MASETKASSSGKRKSDSDRSNKKTSKKSKQEGSHGSSGSTTVKVTSKDDGGAVGAVLVDSPSFRPPESLDLFALGNTFPTLDDSLAVGTRPSKAPNVVIESSNYDLAYADTQEAINQARGYAGQYAVGVYDPDTQTVELHSAPLMTLARSVAPEASSSGSIGIRANYNTARRDLGELFGNRKQKLAMRNADRMKVDTAGMEESVLQGIRDSVQDAPGAIVSTKSGTTQPSSSSPSSLPTAEELKKRPIPLPHLDAATPDAVYPLSEVFPGELASCLNPSPYLHANDSSHIKRLLPQPVARSQWLSARLWSRALASKRTAADSNASASSGILKTSSNHQRQQAKLLLYISVLWSVRIFALQSRDRALNDRKSLREKLRLVPRPGKDDEGEEVVPAGPLPGEAEADALIDGVLSQFCDKERNSGRGIQYHLTPFGEVKLLATIIVLCLHVDGFQVEIDVLAAEMGLKPAKLNEVAKSVGCVSRMRTISTVYSEDGQAGAETKPSTGTKQKVMALKCPVTLPDGSRRKGPARR